MGGTKMKARLAVFLNGVLLLVCLVGQVFSQTKPDYTWLLNAAQRKLLSNAGDNMLRRITGEAAANLQKPQRRKFNPRTALTAPPNVQVNDSSTDTEESTTQSETTIAKSDVTGTIVAGWNDSGELINGSFTGYGRSTDGGATWTDLGSFEPPPGGSHFGDPTLTIHQTTGRFYFATLAQDASGRSIIGVGRSLDDGITFQPQVDASPGLDINNFQDKEVIAVDNSGGLFDGNVYVAWTEFSFAGVQIRFSRSVDGGESFSDPIALNPINFATSGAFPVVDPNGDIYVFWENEDISGIEFVKSTDGGETFSDPALVAGLNLTGEPGPSTLCSRPALNGFIRIQDFPRAAVDLSSGSSRGNVYVVFNSKPSAEDESDIFFTRSTDGGANWSSPIRVNDDGSTNGNFFPEIAVNAVGEISVSWYDRRNSPSNLDIEYFCAFSVDGGVSFGSNHKITDLAIPGFPTAVNFDPVVAGCYMGEYNAVFADGSEFLYAWGDNRNIVTTPFFPEGRSDPDVFFARQAATLAPVPSAPSDLVIARSNSEVNLTWTDPTSNTDGTPLADLDHLNVYRNFEVIATVAAALESFTDDAAGSGFLRYFVTAVNSAGDESAISNALLLATPADSGVCYATTGRADGGRLISIDINTGAGTLIGDTGLGAVPALAINSQGEMFAAEDLTGNLYRIDAATGESEFLSSTGLFALQALAFDNDDVLYGADFSFPLSSLYIINPNNGAVTLIGRSNEFFSGLAFDPTDGLLWGSTGGASPVVFDGIYTIDPTTAQASLVGTTGFGGPTPDIAIDKDGNLFGAKGGGRGTNILISIDKSTGAGALIGEIGFQSISGMAFRPEKPQGSQISLNARTLNFGKVLVGNTSAPRRLTVRSFGTEALTVSAISEPAPPFSLSGVPTLPVILQPGEFIELEVTFTADTTGIVEGEISITSDDEDPPDQIRTVRLVGDGREPAPLGTRLFVVNGTAGTISEIEPITGAVLNIIPAPEPTSAGPDGLAFDGGSLFYVNGFGSNNIYELDPATGEVRNSFPAPNGSLDALAHSGISLFGLDFNSNIIFEMDPTTGAVLNSFTPPVFLVGGITFGGARGTLFVTEGFSFIHELDAFTGAVINSFPAPLSDILGLGYSDNFKVLFAGSASGTVFLLNPDNGEVLDSIRVAGTLSAVAGDEYRLFPGPHISVSPAAINFRRVLIGSISPPHTITIRSIGTETLTVSEISILGAPVTPFSLANVPALPMDLAPRETATFDVIFSPATEETFTDSVSIASNDTSSPVIEVSLRGTGATPPPPGTLFASTGGSNRFITLNPTTGAGSFVGFSEGFGPIMDMDFRADGTLFGSTGEGFSNLITIDFFTGTPALVNAHEFGVITALEFAPDGTLYGSFSSFFGGATQLVTIDTETAQFTFIGPIGFSNVGGLAFGPDGTLYGATSGFDAGGNLITIDTTTGRGTLVGPTGFFDVSALAFSPEGVLYGALGVFDLNTGGLITIDPSSGAGTFVGVSGFPTITGLAFSPAVQTTPVAHAGTDTTVLLSEGASTVSVTLNGSRSYARVGEIVSFTWTGNPDPDDIMNPTVNLGLGTHVFTLVVEDNRGGKSAPDSVAVRVDFAVPVEVSGFNAAAKADRISLSWNIAFHANLRGFDLWRSHSKEGERTKLNEQLIVGETAFAFEDDDVQAGVLYLYALEAIYQDGAAEIVGEVSGLIELPKQFQLTQNFPNPFNPETQIKYELPVAALVTLQIYDIQGRIVQKLVNEEDQPAGFHRVVWNGRDAHGYAVSSGVYFYTILAQPQQKGENRFYQTKKMTLVK
jgi:sugar lactone lactonase YvrE